MAALPGIGAACPDAANVSVNLIPAAGATSPDWGPAELPGPKPATPGQPGGGAQPGAGGQSPSATRLAVAASGARLGKALRRGLTVRVRCEGGRATVVARRGRTIVGRGAARCAAAGARVRVAFTKRAKASLRRPRTVRLTLRATAGGRSRARKVTPPPLKGGGQVLQCHI